MPANCGWTCSKKGQLKKLEDVVLLLAAFICSGFVTEETDVVWGWKRIWRPIRTNTTGNPFFAIEFFWQFISALLPQSNFNYLAMTFSSLVFPLFPVGGPTVASRTAALSMWCTALTSLLAYIGYSLTYTQWYCDVEQSVTISSLI